MTSVKDIMQLCRLCLVKEQVNVPIFEEQGDLKRVIQKISACLPVKVSIEDKLPKKICDGCSYKLELLYQFRNATVNAEKQLLAWINQAYDDGDTSVEESKSQVTTQHIVKEEDVEIPDMLDNGETEFLLEQPIAFEGSDIPFTESQDDNDIDDDATNSSDDEPLAKRRRRLLESQGQTNTENSNQEVVHHVGVAKTEDASGTECEENVDDPDPNFISVGTDDIQQPGPSGLNKATADIPTKQTIYNLTNTLLTDSGGLSQQEEVQINSKLCNKEEYEDSHDTSDNALIIDEEFDKNIPGKELNNCKVDKAGVKCLSFKCTECNKEFMNIHHYRLHVRMHKFTSRRATKICYQCDKIFKSERDLQIHVKNCHQSVQPSEFIVEDIEIICNDINFDIQEKNGGEEVVDNYTTQSSDEDNPKSTDRNVSASNEPSDIHEKIEELENKDTIPPNDESNPESTHCDMSASDSLSSCVPEKPPESTHADVLASDSLPSGVLEKSNPSDIVEISDSDDEITDKVNECVSDKNGISFPKIDKNQRFFIVIKQTPEKKCVKCHTIAETLNASSECRICASTSNSVEGNLVIDVDDYCESQGEALSQKNGTNPEAPRSANVSPLSISVTCVTCKAKNHPSNSTVVGTKILCNNCAQAKLTCTFCLKKSSSLQQLVLHMDHNHLCKICRKFFRNIVKHKSRQVSCDICNVVLCKKPDIQKHYQAVHGKYYCSHCGLVFDSDYALYTHSRAVHSKSYM